MKRSVSFKFLSLLLLSSFLFLSASAYFASPVQADEATFGLLRLNRMKVGSTDVGGTVCLQPSADDTTVTTIAVTFPDGNGTTTGFDLSATAADFTANVTDLPEFGQYPGTTATAFPGINTIVPAVLDQTITYTVASTSLDSATVYCFNFASGLTIRSNAASDLTGTIVTNGTPGETSTYAVATISEDQITVTATVPQIFNFALDATAATLGNLSTSTISSDTVTATLGTNAKNGWVSWVSNSSNGLWSTTQSTAITVPAGSYGTIYDLTSTTGYVLDVTPGTGATIDTAYDGNGTSSGGIMQSSFKQIAFATDEGDSDAFTLNFRAKISAAQPPASDYTDLVTIAAAGEF